MKCGQCNSCQLEKIGCGCDGATDDGCFLCNPQKFKRPPCPSDMLEAAVIAARCIHGYKLTEPCTKC